MTNQGSSPDRSRYQQGVVRRAYEHRDTIALRRLSEIVSDLYLAEGSEKRRLWESAKLALAKLMPNDPQAERVIAKKDLEGLAKLVTKLSAAVRSHPESDQNHDPSAQPGLEESAAETTSSSATSPSAEAQPANPTPSTAATANEPPSQETLKRAMKVFRKRLKLKKLDDESKLGRSPLTGGKSSAVIAIMAPREFPPAVWEELARQGKLRHAGGSFYELAE